MKNLPLKNPFFYATLVLAGLLVFELSGIVAAQYAAPTTAPVGGMPAGPLHAGSATQTKTGILNVKGTGSGVSLNPNGLFYFLGSAGTPVAGFRYNGTSVQYSNNGSSWQDIGTGTGGGTSYWALDAGTKAISYVDGDVVVGRVAATVSDTYYYQGEQAGFKTGSYKLPCDAASDTNGVDCPNWSYVTTDARGSQAFDNYVGSKTQYSSNGTAWYDTPEAANCSVGVLNNREKGFSFVSEAHAAKTCTTRTVPANLKRIFTVVAGDTAPAINRNVVVGGSLVAPNGFATTYPGWNSSMRVNGVDRRTKIEYVRETDRAYFKFTFDACADGGTCSSNDVPIYSKVWRWSKMTGSMRFAMDWYTLGEFGSTGHFEKVLTRSDASGAIFDPGNNFDSGPGENNYMFHWLLDPVPGTPAAYEDR